MDWFANKGQVLGLVVQVGAAVGWPALMTAVVGLLQRLRSGKLDWVILGLLFMLSAGIIYFNFTRIGNRDPALVSTLSSPVESPSASLGPCAVTMSESVRLQLIHFFRSIPKRTVHIYFALEKPGGGSSCRYARDLWEVLDTGGWVPPAVQEAPRLEGRGVWFGAPKKDDAAEDFYKILSDSNDVHLDRSWQDKEHPQDWQIWIRDLWPEWIQRSLLR